MANLIDVVREGFKRALPGRTPAAPQFDASEMPVSTEVTHEGGERPSVEQNEPQVEQGYSQQYPQQPSAQQYQTQPLQTQDIVQSAVDGERSAQYEKAPARRITGYNTTGITRNASSAPRSSDSGLPSSTLPTAANAQPATAAAEYAATEMSGIPGLKMVETSTGKLQPRFDPTTFRVLHAEEGSMGEPSYNEAAAEATDQVFENDSLLQPSASTAAADQSPANQDSDTSQTVEEEDYTASEDALIDSDAANIAKAAGPAGIDEGMAVVKKEPIYGMSRKNRSYKEASDRHRKRVKHKFAVMNRYNGVAFTRTAYADDHLPVYCVSIGMDMLEDSLRDPDSNLLSWVNDMCGTRISLVDAINDIGILAREINAHDLPVTVEKSPVNERQSVQVRTLRIAPGDGVGIHPTQGKAFNLDFDADTLTVNFDPGNVSKYSRGSSYLIGVDGTPAIDLDFFPLDEMTPDQEEAALEYMKETMAAFGFPESVATFLFDDYRDLCNAKEDNGMAMEALRKLIYSIDDISPMYSPEGLDYIGTSLIFQGLWEFSLQRRARSIQMEVADIVASDRFSMPETPTHPLVVQWIDYVNEVVAGRTPPNSVEFGAFFNKQFADYSKFDESDMSKPAGKNIPFRLVADFCKAIHRTDLITIGDPVFGVDFSGYKPDDPVSMQQMWEVTCAALQTKLLKGSQYLGTRQLYIKTQVKARLYSSPEKGGVGLPQYDGKDDFNIFSEWLWRFIDRYNTETRLISMSHISIRNGYRFEREKVAYDGIDVTDPEKFAKGLATALIEVYGDVVLERLLPRSLIKYTYSGQGGKQNSDNSILPEFARMSLSRFAMTNKLRFSSEPVYDEHGKRVFVKMKKTNPDGTVDEVTVGKTMSRKQGIHQRLAARQINPFDILYLVADKRTVKIGEYSGKWETATKDNVQLVEAIMKSIEAKDFPKYIEDMTHLMFMMSPDMFEFFGMDNPLTFVNSKHGKRLINIAKTGNVDQFRSELVSMMMEWRLNRSSKILEAIGWAKAEIIEGGSADIESLYISLDKEYDKLAEASPVWSAIVKEIRSGAANSRFRQFIMSKGRQGLDKPLKAQGFWSDPESEKYGSIITFLKSEAPYSTKMAVLADVTRFHENFPEILPGHIIGYLSFNPNRDYDGAPYDMEVDIQHEMDAVKGSIEAISAYRSKTPEEINKQHSEFMQRVKDDPARFEKWLTRMAAEPNYAVYVDPILAADAISTVFEKAMPDSEKTEQQGAVNGFFECVSVQRQGGFYTHLQQADNKVVNVVGYDQFTFLDLIRILADPDIELYVYDEFGTMTDKPMSRRTLCGGDSISDVIAYLDANPRISSVVRRHVLGVADNIDGDHLANRLKYDDEGDIAYDDVADRVFGFLSDRPRFYASCCLVTPVAHDVGRNIAKRSDATIKYMCNVIADCALVARLNDDFDLDTYIDETFGLSEELIVDLLSSDDIDDIAPWEEDIEERRQIAHAIYVTFHAEIAECIDIIDGSGILSDVSELDIEGGDAISFADINREEPVIGISETSVRAFQDVIQHIGGGRTHKMLNVEGAETKKNECLKVYLTARRERYSMRKAPDGFEEVVIDAETFEDPTLEHDPDRQQNSVAKWMEDKRETGAETGNAKVKRHGDDGKNSITKFDKYNKESLEKGSDLRSAIENAPDRETAVRLLADAIIDADIDLGYIDVDSVFVESDYLNIADLMIGENSEGSVYPDGTPRPHFVIRTIEQLSAAMRSRLTDEVIYEMSQSEQIEVLDEIARDLGTDRDALKHSDESIMYDILVDLPIHGISSNRFSVDRALRRRSSSDDRNYTLLYRLMKRFAREVQGRKDFYIPPRADIEKRSEDVLRGLSKSSPNGPLMVRAVKQYVMKKGKGNSWDWSKSYDLAGRANDPSIQQWIIPGPQSFVLFDQSVHENDALLDYCERYGVTVGIFSTTYPDAGKWDGDLIQIDQNIWIIPFFDLKLNGSFADPIAPAPAQYKANASNFTVTWKDVTGELGPSDSGFKKTEEFERRAHVTARGKNPEIFSMETLFPNMRSRVSGDIKFEIASYDDIMRDIVKPYESGEEYGNEIDVGVLVKNEHEYNRAWRKFNLRMMEYAARFREDANEFGVITEDVRHDSIVTFVKATIDGKTVVYAPVMPFPPQSERSGNRPRRYNIVGFGTTEPYGLDPDTNSFFMNWEYAGGIDGQTLKFFEGYGGSNKFIISPGNTRSRTLANGYPLDGGYFYKTVSGRLASGNLRIITMLSSWYAAKFMPEFSYNFALLAGSFPGDPKTADGRSIKEILRTDPFGPNGLTRKDWEDALPNIDRFFVSDGTERSEKINAVTKRLVTMAVEFGTVNPSILLCSRTETALLEPWLTEFETFMNSSLWFEDAWLTWMHAMVPSLVPDGIYGDDSACLFKVEKNDNGFDPFGTLHCLVPAFERDTGKEYLVPECVFISPGFLGEDFSGIKNIQYNSKNRFLDSINVADNLTPEEQSMILEHGRAKVSHIGKAAMATSFASDGMVEKTPKENSDIIEE